MKREESEKEKELSRWKTWEAYSELQDWRGALYVAQKPNKVAESIFIFFQLM